MEGMCDSEGPMSTTDPTTEVWKPCFQNYEVSNMGRVRRKSDKFPITTRTNAGGYTTCTLYHERKSIPQLVHRLVVLAFLGDHPSGNFSVDHINRKRNDPRLQNLRWATPTEQCFNTGRRKRKKSRPVLRSSDKDVTQYDSIEDAVHTLRVALNIKAKHITVLTRITKCIKSGKEYKGYKWEYINPKPKGRTAAIPSLQRYKASSCGLVCGLSGVWTKGFVRNGYSIVGVIDTDGTPSERRVHRLVAETFCDGQSTHRNVVNHINGNKVLNDSSNLEWTTPSENSKHAHAMGLQATPVGRKINQYDARTGVLVKTHESVRSASREVSAHHQNLTACCRGRQKTAYGFKWGYVYSEEDSVV